MQLKILLVDDREDNLLSIESVLSPDGYKIVKASSGRDALRVLLHEFDFSMILMDVKMPDLNGFETATMIYSREKLKNIPIIFITANNFGDENVSKGYQLGAVDYIYKPVNPNILRAKVAVLVELHRKNLQLIDQKKKLSIVNRNLEVEIRERKASEEKVLQLNRQLIEKIEELETANKGLDRFAFMASHDLQEPLRKIHIFVDRLFLKHDDKMDPQVKSDLSRIQRAAERMQELITGILTFSKLSGDETQFVPLEMNELIAEIVSEMEDEVAMNKAQIIVEPLPRLFGIPSLIRPLFQNLIANAIKYHQKGVPPVVRVYSEPYNGRVRKNGKSEGKKYERILVKDNGIGFDPSYSEEIFQMFKRLHQDETFKGTGIGLTLCKKIVEQHNGFISARSKPNEGSTFIVTLPAATRETEKLMEARKAGA